MCRASQITRHTDWTSNLFLLHFSYKTNIFLLYCEQIVKIEPMSKLNRNLRDLNRVLSAHEWTSIEEWVDSVNALADLSDDEIIELERLTRADNSSVID